MGSPTFRKELHFLQLQLCHFIYLTFILNVVAFYKYEDFGER